jgi:hypothetical protein
MFHLMTERIRHGWSLTRKAWGVIRSQPGLVRLPITGGLLGLLVFAVFAVPAGLLLVADSTGAVVGGFALLLIGVYLSEFVIAFFHVALVAGANQALRGEVPDLIAAKRVARSRLGSIAGWLLVSFLAGMLLGAVRERGGFVGRVSASLGAAMWSLVTFLVLPILAFEGLGPLAAVKRSTTMFRQRWGAQITGNVVIGGVSGLIVFVGFVIGAGGVYLVIAGGTAAVALGVALILVGVITGIGGAVFGGATRSVFGVALYRFVLEDRTLGPFSSVDLAGAARQSRGQRG